jgi:hypothetical protein
MKTLIRQSIFQRNEFRKAAVLIIGFNRPDLLSQLLKNKNLVGRDIYISIDGPRNKFDDAKVRECQEIVLQFTKKNPKSKFQFHLKNLGCKYAVSGAIEWAFNYEKELIIIEDDIEPGKNFFKWMDENLEKFKESEKIWQINGWSPLSRMPYSTFPHLTRYSYIWGWATWKNRWEKYDLELKKWDSNLIISVPSIEKTEISSEFIEYWEFEIRNCLKGFDSWDTQWLFSMWLDGSLALSPGKTLSRNQGFAKSATHTKNRVYRYAIGSKKARIKKIKNQNLYLNKKLDEYHGYFSFGLIPDISQVEKLYLHILKICMHIYFSLKESF